MLKTIRLSIAGNLSVMLALVKSCLIYNHTTPSLLYKTTDKKGLIVWLLIWTTFSVLIGILNDKKGRKLR